MTTHVAISDAELETGDTFDQTLARKLRDNPIAVAEGDVSVTNSYRIAPKAFQDSAAGDYIAFEYTKSSTELGPYTKLFTVYVPRAGYIKCLLAVSAAPASGTAYTKIYKNGVAYGTEFALSISSYPGAPASSGSFEETLSFAAGDALEVWTHGKPASVTLKLGVSNPIGYSRTES